MASGLDIYAIKSLAYRLLAAHKRECYAASRMERLKSADPAESNKARTDLIASAARVSELIECLHIATRGGWGYLPDRLRAFERSQEERK
jgi:hypothetical protein